MASSQVKIASLRCILRDLNRRDNNNDVVLLKAHVKPAEDSQNRVGNKARKKSRSRLGSPEKLRNGKGDNFKRNGGGASSLVQIWEARLNRSSAGNSPIHGLSVESVQEETNLSAPSIDGESEPENETKSHDLTVEIESGESKWGRVAEIIRKLKVTAGDNVGDADIPNVKTPVTEKSSFPVVTSSPRLRGRQAFSDLLMRLERERHRELESLVKRNAVSKFTQRGRLQSMLRLRSLKRGLLIQDRHRSNAKTPYLNRLELGSTVLHLRERFQPNAASEAELKKGEESTVETERLSTLKKETEPKMSYLQVQETMIPEETVLLEKQETSFAWEEQEEYEDEQSYYGEMSNDWYTEISRPRSYWEDLRKSRYLEVMNSRSDKDDICRLLERRTVSDFLQSGLREKIDKLIMSRVQTHPVQQIEEAEEEDDLSHTSSQIFAPSWSSQDIGVTSTPDLLPQSTEMESISELRSQIQQLQLEMSELRDSVKTCLDVNASLQKSVDRENPLKRKCCVCNETQVETLLYRCGHMCTCLRCANELQCNGGKCPICCAKILDVVRVFFASKT